MHSSIINYPLFTIKMSTLDRSGMIWIACFQTHSDVNGRRGSAAETLAPLQAADLIRKCTSERVANVTCHGAK